MSTGDTALEIYRQLSFEHAGIAPMLRHRETTIVVFYD
jgi:hypothetical protein